MFCSWVHIVKRYPVIKIAWYSLLKIALEYRMRSRVLDTFLTYSGIIYLASSHSNCNINFVHLILVVLTVALVWRHMRYSNIFLSHYTSNGFLTIRLFVNMRLLFVGQSIIQQSRRSNQSPKYTHYRHLYSILCRFRLQYEKGKTTLFTLMDLRYWHSHSAFCLSLSLIIISVDNNRGNSFTTL